MAQTPHHGRSPEDAVIYLLLIVATVALVAVLVWFFGSLGGGEATG